MTKRKKIGIAVGLTAAIAIAAAAILGGAVLAWRSGSSSSTAYVTDSGMEAVIADSGYSSYVSAESDMYSEDSVGSSAMTKDNIAELSGDENTESSDLTEQKLIVTWSINMQTEKYEDALAEIKNSISAEGGYIESEDESSYYEDSRCDYLTIRIPAERADAWIDGAAGYGTIVNRSKSTEDVTLNYVDMQSRLNALRTEQETLMGLMEKAEDMSDLIAIQSQLTDVCAEIDSYESQLRVLDNRVNYTTINMEVEEVHRESPVEKTFGEEVSETFLNSIENLGNFFRRLAIFILGNSVTILLIALFITAVVLFIRKMKKRGSKTKKQINEK